jgi:hypothetical protein
MIDPTDRCFVKNVEQLFSRDALIRTREYLKNIWKTIDPDALSAREKKNHLIFGVAPDEIRFDHTWYNLWKSVSPEKIYELRPYTRLMFPIQIRRILQDDMLVPWHQDVTYQYLRKNGGQDHLITCFVPVEPEPTTVPTVEFAVGEFPTITYEQLGNHGATLELSDFPDTIHFELNCGDALVFGDHALHRTYVPANVESFARWSFEYRLVRPEDCLSGSDYFDIEEKVFIRI